MSQLARWKEPLALLIVAALFSVAAWNIFRTFAFLAAILHAVVAP